MELTRDVTKNTEKVSILNNALSGVKRRQGVQAQPADHLEEEKTDLLEQKAACKPLSFCGEYSKNNQVARKLELVIYCNIHPVQPTLSLGQRTHSSKTKQNKKSILN